MGVTTYEPGTRVMHNDDRTQGTVLDWNADKGFGTIKFDDGEILLCDPSVLQPAPTPQVPCPTCHREGDFNTFTGAAVEKIVWENYPEPYNVLRPEATS